MCEDRESLRARESERQEKRRRKLVTIEGISASRLLRLLTFHTGEPQRGTVVIAPDATLTLPEAALPSAAMAEAHAESENDHCT